MFMDSLAVIGAVFESSRIILDVLNIWLKLLARGRVIARLYGPSGILLLYFGSRTTWRVEAQVLGQMDEQVALNFKKSVQDECTMISVAAAIIAQIAITALSLSSVSQTHWTVRGFSVFSLTSALMAVYYATTQHRVLGRLLSAQQIRTWIRGSISYSEKSRLVPTFDELLLRTKWGRRFYNFSRNLVNLSDAMFAVITSFGPGIGSRMALSDPDDIDADDLRAKFPSQIENTLLRQSFTPGVASVITISAPQMLLSSSLITLLTALGIYLGFLWTQDLGTNAGPNDSQNIFIMYIVGLGVCVLVYSISQLVQNEDTRDELLVLRGYLKSYIENHPELLERLELRFIVQDDGTFVFNRIAAPHTGPRNTTTSAMSEHTNGQIELENRSSMMSTVTEEGST